MDNQTRELIAVGASVSANCQPCIKYHLAKVRQAGADEADILEAVTVGKMVRKGAAGAMDKLLATVFEGIIDDAETKGCGCK